MLRHSLRGQYEAITGELDIVFCKQQYFREIWIKNALHHVGKHAIEGLSHETISHTLQQVSEEVHHEYILSMRKSIVNYILQVSALSILI